MIKRKIFSFIRVLSRFLIIPLVLTVGFNSPSRGEESPDWIQWTHWVASPQGQVWLAGPQGQEWLKKQVWLKTVVIEQAPLEVQTDLRWLKDQYLKQEMQLGGVTYPIWPGLPCTGYFNASYRQENLDRLFRLYYTQGDVVLFMGDSLTQQWTDSVVNLQKPSCGTVFNSGLYDWTSLPGVKVNLGLYGIRTCSWLYEYDRFFRERTKLFANRIKSVVINLGTNDVLQLANNPDGSPKSEVKYIKQLIDELKVDLPNAYFIVTTISPCLNSLCGNYYEREFRVREFNNELFRQLQGYSNRTIVQYFDLKETDLTVDKIHYNACAFQKIANGLRPWISNAIKNTWPQSVPSCPLTPSNGHPCSLIKN